MGTEEEASTPKPRTVAALAMTGLIPTDALRLPLVPADAAQRAVVRTALEGVGLAQVDH